MKIRFLVSIGDVTGWNYDFGEIADVTETAAQAFIRNGKAVAIAIRCPHCQGDLTDLHGLETTALAGAPEQAVLAGAKPRKS